MIYRHLASQIAESLLHDGKIVILYGPRQTGKTTLVRSILDQMQLSVLAINADERRYHGPFSYRDFRKMKEVVDEREVLFIDEAQQIDDIGINLKILHDGDPGLKIIVTGSSSFDLANRTQEPLTGRTRTFRLFPVSVSELRQHLTPFEIRQNLDEYLLYGMYPEVLTMPDSNRKKEHLIELSRAYLYKDVLSLANIRNSDKIHKLLQLIALQVGSGVSINKLANALDLSHDTIVHYLDLLEKSFVLFRHPAYSKNLSKEISKMDKIYFYDTGIRNAILENFTSLDLRLDRGALWENFIIAERLKMNVYHNRFVRSYYWRVYTGAEIDLVEESEGMLSAFEIKANDKWSAVPKSWQENYPHAAFQTVNMENWLDWLLTPSAGSG